MPEIALTQIKVDAATRQRESVENIDLLAKSIEEYGLLEPIILDNDFNLVAGFRRLMAHLLLGKDTIQYVSVGKLDSYRAKAIELEENVQRQQLTWQEESKAIAELHALKMAHDPTWTTEKSAAALNVSKRKVYNALELATAIDTQPEVAKADTQMGAMMRLGQIKQLAKRREDAQVRVMAENIGLRPKISAEIRHGDAFDLLKAMPDTSADMVISNPPYGVDIESVFMGDRKIYEDAAKDIVPLLYKVAEQAFRVLKNDRWFVWFYPTVRLAEGIDILEKAGFKLPQHIPCIWYKPNKILATLSNPYQQFPSQYETFFWAKKGEPRFNKLRLGNVWVYDTPDKADRVHPLQMPSELWREIIDIGSVTGELIVEPFSGSGMGGVACVQLDRNYIGLELSEEYVKNSRMVITEAMTGPPPESLDSSANFAQATKDPGTIEQLKALEFKV